MTNKHLEFCLNYLRTNDPGVAYKMTYPKASVKSLYAAASRLMARQDVSAWIEDTHHRVHERALREIEEQQGAKLKEQLMTINEKRTVLTQIIKGETKRKRHIKTKYGTREVEDDLPIYAVLRAIDMDTRLENFYNYLSNPATWHRAQNIYVNTPTLQQQVNVLIAQAQHTPACDTEPAPVAEGQKEIGHPEEACTIEQPTPELITEAAEVPVPVQGHKPAVSKGASKKKIPRYLTLLNNFPRNVRNGQLSNTS